jgi:hypothetical protein
MCVPVSRRAFVFYIDDAYMRLRRQDGAQFMRSRIFHYDTNQALEIVQRGTMAHCLSCHPSHCLLQGHELEWLVELA